MPRNIAPLEAWLREASNPSFAIESVNSLSAALVRLDKGGLDVVVLDLFLPETKGLKTLPLVRSQSPAIPIVALTQYRDEHTGVHAVREGAQDYLLKDEINSHLLRRAIDHSLEPGLRPAHGFGGPADRRRDVVLLLHRGAPRS